MSLWLRQLCVRFIYCWRCISRKGCWFESRLMLAIKYMHVHYHCLCVFLKLVKNINHQSRQICLLHSKRWFEKMCDSDYDPYPYQHALKSVPPYQISKTIMTPPIQLRIIECILVRSQECISHACKKFYYKITERNFYTCNHE